MKQKELIVNVLLNYGVVSRNWALSNYISRLSAIIYDLTHEYGWEFETEKVKTIKPNGEKGWDYVYKVKKFGINPYNNKNKKRIENV